MMKERNTCLHVYDENEENELVKEIIEVDEDLVKA